MDNVFTDCVSIKELDKRIKQSNPFVKNINVTSDIQTDLLPSSTGKKCGPIIKRDTNYIS